MRYVVTPNEDIIKAREKKLIRGNFMTSSSILVVSTVAGVESSSDSRDRLALMTVLAPEEMPASLSQVVIFLLQSRILLFIVAAGR